MEGLIPFVYKAIVQYKSGGQGAASITGGAWFSESPSSAYSYIRLPGDSGRYQASEIQLFRPEFAFSASSSSPSRAPVGAASSNSTIAAAHQSPVRYHRSSSRRLVS